MAKTHFPYVEDEILLRETQAVLDGVTRALEVIDTNFNKNVIDPFSALFDASSQNIAYDKWIDQEKHRQLQKTLQNTIGYFHERIIAGVEGWQSPDSGGYDVENQTKKIIAEIKNKHNTMNSSSGEAVYTKMTSFLKNSKKGYMGYVVTIIPKKPTRFVKPYQPSVRKVKLPARKDLKIVDGATFYQMVTNDPDALEKLYTCLPKVIQECIGLSSTEFKPQLEKFEELFIKAFRN